MKRTLRVARPLPTHARPLAIALRDTPRDTLRAALRAALTAGLLAAGTPLLAQPGGSPPAPAPVPAADAPGGFARASLPALLAQGRQLLRERNPQAALAVLDARTPDYAGNEEFDYLLGIAALDSGEPARAVIALERVLAANPANTLARAEIARAFLALQETDAARREFQSVAGADLPPAVRDTISRYLEIIAQADRGAARRWSASIDVATGWDSNVNLGSSLDRWVLGDGQALTPLPTSRPRKSAFHAFGGQVQYVAPINGRTDWTIGANLNQRINPSQHNTDLGSVEVSSGLATTRGRNRYSVSVQLQQLWLDDESFRDAAGLLGQWQREVDSRTQVGVYGQLFSLRFPDQSVRNARRQVVGATLVHALNDAAQSVAVANAYAGRESSTEGIGELSFDLFGIRAGLNRRLTGSWRGSASLSFERRRNDAADGFFGQVRADSQYEIRLGAERELDKHLSLSPQIAYTRNASNLGPNDFRRTQIQLSARYKF